ncbi:hypothetical protein ANN_23918 [Periplaneta americana]|uniref:Uncharacterized protein n=1 Tax=Periplaneta americana TaxID=6978 RepID=A0ABQ8S1X7_PERAM|nr:hypothetical protein ANN_23918 [Periplaneta americana]
MNNCGDSRLLDVRDFGSDQSGRLETLTSSLYVTDATLSQSKQARLVCRSSTRVCVRICVSIRRPEFECSGPQLEGPEFECSGPQLEGPQFEYSELSLKVCGSRYCELEKRSIFCESLEKELRKRKCFVWSVALYEAETWTLRRSEEMRLEAFKMWIWRRMECVKWTDRIRNEAEEEKELTRSLDEKKLPSEECTGRNGKREKSWGKKIYGSNEETKKKAENRKDWIMLGLQYSLSKITIITVLCVILKFKSWNRYHDHLHEPPERTVAFAAKLQTTCNSCGWLRLSFSLSRFFSTLGARVAHPWKTFRAKRDEVTGEWRKLHNTELHALYSSPDIIRNIKSRHLRWAGHVARMGESRNAYRVSAGRPEGKRPLGRQRRRLEDNIKMDLREMGYDDRDWINLAKDRDQWRDWKNSDSLPKENCVKKIGRRGPCISIL